MNMIKIAGTALAAKKIKVKRDTVDKVEVLRCHLAVSDIFVDRRIIDWLCGQAKGWAAGALFDDLGAPRMRFDIRLKDLQYEAGGRVFRPNTPEQHNSLILPKDTKVTKVRLELQPNGALMSVRFTWNSDGDEVPEASGMLGRDVEVGIDLSAPEQTDALKPDSQAVQKPKGRGRGRRAAPDQVPIEMGDGTLVDPETGEVLEPKGNA